MARAESFSEGTVQQGRPSWPSYRTVWRWHFYAGLFCIPFVLWLAITGSFYLFKPQIEQWLDRPYDHLVLTGSPATPEAQTVAALAVVPGASLHFYEIPKVENGATRVIVGKGDQEYRVYVHPQTLEILKTIREDRRPMRLVLRLHGELLAGDWGSRIVELAASWAIVMIVTGMYLWWPRQTRTLAGLLYVRLSAGRRIFWRDLHAVTGFWISACALFLLLTGLPWAKSWGGYLQLLRSRGGHSTVRQDWTTGRSSEIENRMAMNDDSMMAMSMERHSHTGSDQFRNYAALNRLVPAVAALHLADPVYLMPPRNPSTAWTAKSDAQNRPLRAVVTLRTETGAVLKREDFDQRPWVDRVVGVGIAAHEGQLFGPLNQLLGLGTALGLVLLSVSAVVLWWRRRDVGLLGAPVPAPHRPVSWTFLGVLALFGLCLPMLGASLLLVLLIESYLLRRIPGVQRWLGLQPA